MSYHFLNECEGNKEIIIEDNCVRLKYKHRSEEKEYLINYSDVKSLSLLRYESVYLLDIEVEDMIINLNIDIDDFDKIEKCKELYNKVLTTLSNCYPEDDIISEYKEDS